MSKENDFATDVTKEELAAIFSTAQKWSDVRPEWPAEDILRYVPGTDSGTFDYFVEAIMGPANLGADGKADLAKGEKVFLKSSNLNQSEDDNVLVQGVEGSPYAIGFFGFAYYTENADKFKVLSVGGITPDAKTAELVNYPISRPASSFTAREDPAGKTTGCLFSFTSSSLKSTTKSTAWVTSLPARKRLMNSSNLVYRSRLK